MTSFANLKLMAIMTSQMMTLRSLIHISIRVGIKVEANYKKLSIPFSLLNNIRTMIRKKLII
jgi:hypothetical protein